MTNLEEMLGLVEVIAGRSARSGSAQPRCAPVSGALGVVRETALVWRALQLERQCPFTSRLLRRLGCVEAVLIDYFSLTATWPDFEGLSRDFLHSLRFDDNPLIRAVSQFELAALQAKAGRGEVFEILWDRDPDAVLWALQNDGALPAVESAGGYRVRMDPKSWSITRQ